MLGRGTCHLDRSLCIRLLVGNGEKIAQVRGPFPGGGKGQDVFRVRACFGELVLEVLIYSYCRVVVWIFAVPADWAKHGTSGQSAGLWQSVDPLGLRWYLFAKYLPFGCTTWDTVFLLTAHTLLGPLLHSLAASSSSNVGSQLPIFQPQYALVESQTGCQGWWLQSLDPPAVPPGDPDPLWRGLCRWTVTGRRRRTRLGPSPGETSCPRGACGPLLWQFLFSTSTDAVWAWCPGPGWVKRVKQKLMAIKGLNSRKTRTTAKVCGQEKSPRRLQTDYLSRILVTSSHTTVRQNKVTLQVGCLAMLKHSHVD